MSGKSIPGRRNHRCRDPGLGAGLSRSRALWLEQGQCWGQPGAEVPGRGPRARSGRRGQRGQEGRDLPVCAQSMDVKSQGFEQEDDSRALDGDPCAMMGWDVGWS